jgi:hypothetical protein
VLAPAQLVERCVGWIVERIGRHEHE